MKTFNRTITASRLFFGVAHCLGIALLGLYLFDEQNKTGRQLRKGLRTITIPSQNR